MWEKLNQWTREVKHTEPQQLVGGITYYRQNDWVGFEIPLRPITNADFELKAYLVLSDNGTVYYPVNRCTELHRNLEMLKFILEHVYIDEVVVDRPVVSIRFVRDFYSPDLRFYIMVWIHVDLNFLDNRFVVDLLLEDNEWHFEMFGTRLWKVLQERELTLPPHP
jgi:hypothetical protein